MRIYTSLFTPIFLFCAEVACAQSQAELSSQVESALQRDDLAAALLASGKLYEMHIAENNIEGAGRTAYSRAKILEARSENLEAGSAYKLCAEHFKDLNALAQSLNCKYDSGLAYLSGGKKGTAIDILKATAKDLEEIGQAKSGLAAKVYLTLAEEILPPKLDHKRAANRTRNSSAKYANLAMSALDALGENSSELYASALLIKGRALEDSEKYDQAALAYTEAVDLYESLPNGSPDILENIRSRASIAMSQSKGGKSDNTLDVLDNDGNKITLTVDKKRKVHFPRIDRNKLVDGARVKALITLEADGKVETIEILESYPEEEFGAAFEKAARKWIFNPPDGVSASEIPPFEYGMNFYVQRR